PLIPKYFSQIRKRPQQPQGKPLNEKHGKPPEGSSPEEMRTHIPKYFSQIRCRFPGESSGMFTQAAEEKDGLCKLTGIEALLA
ncbi:MAG TPA: hypothetical protein VEA37_04135, partial [Flavobacterium sp.]|nr:hypothetical protein [Flavobacterium sp.]